MPQADDGRVPSLAHLHEQVIVALKSIPLFADVSRRLIDDLVANVGIETVGPIGRPPLVGGREPIVLLVLERPVLIDAPGGLHIRLLPGTYLRDHQPFGGPAVEAHAWAASEIRSADDDRARVFLLDRPTFAGLPRIMVQAFDPDELKHLKTFFSH